MKDFLKTLIAPVLVAFLAAGAANAAFWQWSKTTGDNASADPTINFREGQSPSSVNDSARALMARVAEYRDDISGSLTTGGTSTAYTLTTNEGLGDPPQNGQLIAFTMSATNGASPTLAVDGGTAYPIRTDASTAVASGALVAGTPYTAKFDTSASAWILRNYYNFPSGVPIGTVLPYSGATAPSSNYVMANGQCISRTTYATYFTLVSTTYGGCDGSTTFAVPDLRGRVVAGNDTLGTSAASRLTSTYYGTSAAANGAAGGQQDIALSSTNQLPQFTPSISDTRVWRQAAANLTGDVNSPGNAYPANVTAGYRTASDGSYVAAITAVSGTISAAAVGSASPTPFATIQPTLTLSYIVRVQ